ncbi:NADH dehydrogenase [compost metagenome]
MNRWSSRAFAAQSVEEATLLTVLEAARWAPSSNNLQPWRFIVAHDSETLKVFHEFIVPGNREWADQAPVLILILSAAVQEDGKLNGAHAFDTGAAWSAIALQASLLGLNTRAIGGYDRVKARELLSIPADYELHAVIALGYPGSVELLPDKFKEKNVPSGRRSLRESIIFGGFSSEQSKK